jgi:type I restriction enzyme R subunit
MNQNHAKFIVERFEKRYPQYPAGFISMIHNKVSHAQSLIEAFCDHNNENLPQIAVSVDMMDTGIDAPRTLNLVFFKVVRSYAKFWQMIGRGTRLCPDVFGPNQDKDCFVIFDVCQNFEFFEVKPKGIEGGNQKTLSQQIFEGRLDLSRLLNDTGEEENLELGSTLRDILHMQVQQLDKKRFQVEMHLRYVDEFSKRARWNTVNADDSHVVEEHLSFLPVPETDNEIARRFDLMMIKLQIASLMLDSKEKNYQSNLIEIAEQLSKKYSIPQVVKAKVLIESMKDPDFYKKLSQKRYEEIREEIRSLVQYLDKTTRVPVYTNYQDSEVEFTEGVVQENGLGYGIYRKRIESFVRENKKHITIAKLCSNQVLNNSEIKALEDILFNDDRGSKEDFVKQYGEQPLGAFIRSILGLIEESAREAFSVFLQAGNLRADQMTFINRIISYLTKNGTIEKEMLFEAPFTDMHDQGLVGVFDDGDATKVISIIDSINSNAQVG